VSHDKQVPQAPSGTHDVMPPESARWEAFLVGFASLARRYGFGMVHTPLFEDIRVFHRGIGEGSEVVGKEMYEFTDRGGRHLALRPEGTASIVRAYIQHRPVLPFRAWYATPSFRYERPQAGRYRQHHQVGVEVLGSDDPDVDVEVISLAQRFFESLGLGRFSLRLNSMGDGVCRPAYVEALREFLDLNANELCEDHRASYSANPLRVLDCKREACHQLTDRGPKLVEVLCEPCREHFARVQAGLYEAEVTFSVDDRLVRGFDYYTRTTFEFSSEALEGAQNAIGGGGRYDGLVETLGGPPTPGIGFGIGIERVLLACDAEDCFEILPAMPVAFVVDVTGGELARQIVERLREAGLYVERAYDQRSMKAQLKAADRSGAPLALLVGEDERARGQVSLRRLREESEQWTIDLVELYDRVEETGTII
jgi:histidyl-tRNA synthetase